MKTKYLDNEIQLLYSIKRNNEISDYGQEKLNEFIAIKKQLTLTDVMRSNLALLWWGWTTVWGVIGFIVGCIKLWNYYA